MSLYNVTSIPHLHAAARRQDLIREAAKVRLIATAREDRTTVGVRRQLGGALIRAGEMVRGPLTLKAA